MRSFFRFILATKAMKSSMIKTSGIYPDTDFHWFLGFLSDQLPLGVAVELSLGIYPFSDVSPIYDTVSRNESSFLGFGLVHRHEEGKRYGSGLVPAS